MKDSLKKDTDRMLYQKDSLYIPKVIRTEPINKYHNNLLAGHFKIDKTQELITQKYYWLTIQANVKTYIKAFDICLLSKIV